MNQYVINDNYGYQDYQYLDELLDYALKKLHVENGVFSVILTDDFQIKELNKKYRNIDEVTDVISFALKDSDTFISEIDVLGDIYISIPVMKRQAVSYNHSEKRELSFLVIHGLLHLLGYNHQVKSEEKIMFDLQKEILNEKDIIN